MASTSSISASHRLSSPASVVDRDANSGVIAVDVCVAYKTLSTPLMFQAFFIWMILSV
jgi:hypothetical protein